MKPFRDRTAAGLELANLLAEYAGRRDVLVLALPRGGVPVAFEVATALDAPLDVMVVRKIGAPGDPEFALGALASGDVVVMNDEIPRSLCEAPEVAAVVAHERKELARREQAYRVGRPPLALKGRTVLLVDDGAATGSTMRAAVRAARKRAAREVVVALPLASVDAAGKLAEEADRVICIDTPHPFHAVGQWYVDFPQTTDAEVRDFLGRVRRT